MSTKYDTNPGSKSADEVQREVRESRAQVEETLEAIQERLSPGQMFDQAVHYLRSSGGNDFVRNFGATVRDNPVPVALLGTGLAWLMLSKPRPQRPYYYDDDEEWDEERVGDYPEYESDYRTGYYPPGYYAAEHDDEVVFDDEAVFRDRPPGTQTTAGAEPGGSTEEGFSDRAKESAESALHKAEELRARAQDSAHGIKEGAQEKARDWGSAARETSQEWRAGARSAADRGRARARRLGAGARHRVSDAASHVRHGARDAQARAGYYGRRVQRGFLDTLQDQPLVLGAFGLAVGAAIGAALPATATEDEWMGDTRDRLKNRAERLSREQLEKARAAGQAAYEAALEEAERQGLTPEGAMRAAEAAERKAESVADAASQAAKSEAERQKVGQSSQTPSL